MWEDYFFLYWRVSRQLRWHFLIYSTCYDRADIGPGDPLANCISNPWIGSQSQDLSGDVVPFPR
jgi:hypothetical protein